MGETLLWVVAVLLLVNLALLVYLLFNANRGLQNTGKEVREELRAGREETRINGKELRQEISEGIKITNDSIYKTLASM